MSRRVLLLFSTAILLVSAHVVAATMAHLDAIPVRRTLQTPVPRSEREQ